MDKILIMLIVAVVGIQSTFAESYPCKERYSKKVNKRFYFIDVPGPAIMGTTFISYIFKPVVFLPLLGATVIVVPTTAAIASYQENQIFPVYYAFEVADYSEKELDDKFEKEVMDSRIRFVNDKSQMDSYLNEINSELHPYVRRITYEELKEKILLSEIDKRPSNVIDQIRKKLDSKLSYDEVRNLVLKVRAQDTMCSSPLKLKGLKALTKEAIKQQKEKM